MAENTENIEVKLPIVLPTESDKGLVPLVEVSAEELAFGENYQDGGLGIEEEHPFGREKHMPSSDYYWNSYAHFGIHEVLFCLFFLFNLLF